MSEDGRLPWSGKAAVVPLGTPYDHHGAMTSGGRIRLGLFRDIVEADLADKQAEGMKPVERPVGTADSAPRRQEFLAVPFFPCVAV